MNASSTISVSIVRYEDLRADPPGEFRKLLTELGQTEINDNAFLGSTGVFQL